MHEDFYYFILCLVEVLRFSVIPLAGCPIMGFFDESEACILFYKISEFSKLDEFEFYSIIIK